MFAKKKKKCDLVYNIIYDLDQSNGYSKWSTNKEFNRVLTLKFTLGL